MKPYKEAVLLRPTILCYIGKSALLPDLRRPFGQTPDFCLPFEPTPDLVGPSGRPLTIVTHKKCTFKLKKPLTIVGAQRQPFSALRADPAHLSALPETLDLSQCFVSAPELGQRFVPPLTFVGALRRPLAFFGALRQHPAVVGPSGRPVAFVGVWRRPLAFSALRADKGSRYRTI